MRSWAWKVALLAAVCATNACGGGSGGDGNGPPATPINLTGSWTGSWASTTNSGSGTVTFDLTQSGSDISGTFSRSGSACFTAGNISGAINGKNVTLSALLPGPVRVDFDGTAVESQMNGSFDVSGTGCTADAGAWIATKQPGT